MENNEKPQQRKRRYKEEPNGNLELKNTVTEIKILTDGLSSRMGTTKERINEVEERPIKLRCPICLLSSQQMEASLEKKKK